MSTGRHLQVEPGTCGVAEACKLRCATQKRGYQASPDSRVSSERNHMLLPTLLNVSLTPFPRNRSATIATMAIRPRMSAYSARP